MGGASRCLVGYTVRCLGYARFAYRSGEINFDRRETQVPLSVLIVYDESRALRKFNPLTRRSLKRI